jgi:hypothetical protein
VAEAADPPVPLSSILEAAGLRVVGRASTPEELERLLGVTRPGVVVFDARMSVEALSATRQAEPHIGIVAVWPAGIESQAVNAVVLPGDVRRDLAAAVRRATPVPAKPRRWVSSPAAAAVAAPAAAAGRPRSGGVELAVAAALTFLLVVTAVMLRGGENGGGTLAQGPGASTPRVQPDGTQVSPPDGPIEGTSNTATILISQPLIQQPTPLGGGGGGGRGHGGGNGGGPTPAGPVVTARERECRSAAGLRMHEHVGTGRRLQKAFDRCVATDSTGPLRALAKLMGHGTHGSGHGSGAGAGSGGPGGGGSGGAGGGGSGGHGHAYGHDPDHVRGHSADHPHGHAYGHSADHGHGHGHAYGHSADHGHGHGHAYGHSADHGHGHSHAYGHDADHGHGH